MEAARLKDTHLTDRGARLALWALPLLFTVLLFAMRTSSLPFWQSFNLDPDYYYLLNGLRLVEGLAPTDVSHPGTPVQMVIAATVRLLHPFESAEAVVDAVLADPERYLLAATTVIYALVGAALWLMGRSVFAATGLLWPALLAQSAPFLSRVIPKFAIHPKPEPFLIVAVALLAAALMPLTRNRPPEDRPSDRHSALAGIAMALGVACKVHFVLLGVIPLLLLDRRRLLIYAGTGAAALVVFIAPAIPSWDIWTDWIGRMILGAGAYGEGAQTVIDTGRYPKAVLKLFSSKLIMTTVFVLSLAQLAIYFRLRRRSLIERDRVARLLAGILLAQLLVVLSVAKQPAAHYLVPALLLTGPALAALWLLSRRISPPPIHRRAWMGIAAVLVLAQGWQMMRQNAELAGWTAETQSVDMRRFDGCAKLYFDAASAPSYALQRGDMNTLGRYSPKLAKLFPADEYTWFTNDHSWWKRGLMQWNQPADLAQVLAGYPCAVFRGNQPWTAVSEARRLIADFRFDAQCEVGEETLFTKGVACDGARAH